MSRRGRRGVTLVELIVVLAILGVVAGVTGLTLRVPTTSGRAPDWRARLAEARRQALREGRPATVLLSVDGRMVEATAFPDGSVAADRSLPIEPLSGRASGEASRRDSRER